MSESSLQLTNPLPPDDAKQFTAWQKKLTTWFRLMRNSEAQKLGYRVLIGNILNQAKERLKHGQFEAWVEEQFGLAKPTQYRWRQFATLFLAEAEKLPAPTVGQKSHVELLNKPKKQAVNLILEVAPKVMDGRGEIEFMRDCKFLRLPKPAGGFRPNAEMVQAWLKEHHPDFLGKLYDDLPADVQNAFKKQYRAPGPTPEEVAELNRDFWRHIAAQIGEQLPTKTFCELDAPERKAIAMTFHDAWKALSAVDKEAA
jgi:hypothetical protein